MNRTELRKANGDVFFEATREAANSYILVNWVGLQSLESIMMGANHLLQMLRQQPVSAILNSNKELIGPWDEGALFLGSDWAPKARVLGVKNFAHVLTPGIYGKRAFEHFVKNADKYLSIRTFESDHQGANWLLAA